LESIFSVPIHSQAQTVSVSLTEEPQGEDQDTSSPMSAHGCEDQEMVINFKETVKDPTPASSATREVNNESPESSSSDIVSVVPYKQEPGTSLPYPSHTA